MYACPFWGSSACMILASTPIKRTDNNALMSIYFNKLMRYCNSLHPNIWTLLAKHKIQYEIDLFAKRCTFSVHFALFSKIQYNTEKSVRCGSTELLRVSSSLSQHKCEINILSYPCAGDFSLIISININYLHDHDRDQISVYEHVASWESGHSMSIVSHSTPVVTSQWRSKIRTCLAQILGDVMSGNTQGVHRSSAQCGLFSLHRQKAP